MVMVVVVRKTNKDYLIFFYRLWDNSFLISHTTVFTLYIYNLSRIFCNLIFKDIIIFSDRTI
jgi:hypothetical protein